MPSSAAETIVLDQPRANGEVLRASFNPFKGRLYVSLRSYYRDDAGDLCPGRNGINVPLDEFPLLEKAVAEIRSQLNRQRASA